MIVIGAPFFFQVTFVAGPPVGVQVRDLIISLYTSSVEVGTPEMKNHGVDIINSGEFPDITQSMHVKVYYVYQLG